MRLPLMSPRHWVRRVVFSVGAVLVSAVAIIFAALADHASDWFAHLQDGASSPGTARENRTLPFVPYRSICSCNRGISSTRLQGRNRLSS